MRGNWIAAFLLLAWNGGEAHIDLVPGTLTSPRDDLQDFADGFFADQTERLDIPGAVFVVVAEGKTLFAAGYGVTNRDTQTPVDPETTRFRVASVGKVFTALAVLRLVEDGQLDLAGDINEVLARPIDDAGMGPVTLSQLLLHTAGFDERLIGYLAAPGQPVSLGNYLARRMPRRSFPPGGVSRYSNHGYALAGLVVEQVSGRSFGTYAAEEIFQPLGMLRTAYLTLPLPDWVDELATEYWASGEIAPVLVSNPYPAGSLATTAKDMSRFLLALLADPERQSSEAAREVIGDSSRNWLETVQLRHHPRLSGLTYGLARTWIRGRDLVLKSGSGRCHSAIIGFLPGQGVGFFGAVNRQEPQIWTRLLPQLVEFFPESADPEVGKPAASESDVHSHEARGEYRLARYAEGSIERLLSLAAHATVTATGEDSVNVSIPVEPALGGDFYREAGSVFRSEDGDRSIAFRSTGGHATHLFLDLSGEPFAFERVRREETVSATMLAIGVVVFLSVSMILASAVRGVGGLLRGSRESLANGGERLAGRLALGSSFLNLAVLIWLVLALAKWKEWAQAAPGELIFATVLAPGVPLLAVACLIASGQAWRKSYWGFARRIHYSAGVLATLLFAFLLLRYNVWPGRI